MEKILEFRNMQEKLEKFIEREPPWKIVAVRLDLG